MCGKKNRNQQSKKTRKPDDIRGDKNAQIASYTDKKNNLIYKKSLSQSLQTNKCVNNNMK